MDWASIVPCLIDTNIICHLFVCLFIGRNISWLPTIGRNILWRVSASLCSLQCNKNADGSPFNKNIFHDWIIKIPYAYEYKYYTNVIRLWYKYYIDRYWLIQILKAQVAQACAETIKMQRPFVSVSSSLIQIHVRGILGKYVRHTNVFDAEIQITIMSWTSCRSLCNAAWLAEQVGFPIERIF